MAVAKRQNAFCFATAAETMVQRESCAAYKFVMMRDRPAGANPR
jgi:hypothetical protein